MVLNKTNYLVFIELNENEPDGFLFLENKFPELPLEVSKGFIFKMSSCRWDLKIVQSEKTYLINDLFSRADPKFLNKCALLSLLVKSMKAVDLVDSLKKIFWPDITEILCRRVLKKYCI